MSEDKLNSQQLDLIRSMYSESLNLLKDKSLALDLKNAEKHTNLRFELQKLGFASIYNLKKCSNEGMKIEESVIKYMEKRFESLNNSIHDTYNEKQSEKI